MVSMIRPPCDDGVIRGTRADAPCPPATGPWILAAAVLGAGMVFAGGTVVTVMLPTFQTGFGADAGDAQWVVAAYALGLAALTLVGGALGDHFGRRRVYGVGLALFALASLWCTLAPSIGQLIAARAAQGIGGALVLPGSLALIGASFAGEERGKAIGTWAAFATVTAGGGPILGGVLVELASWRWAFAVNLPLTAVALAILLRRVPESRDPTTARLDWRGAALATA
ncbi:MAG: MFS transporter, partial [Chloroflexota bacterium]|nr:MFS transporter [Chloroflexota bacterium]